MLKLNYQSVRLYTSYAKKQGDIFKKLKYRWLKKSCYNIFKVYSTLIQLDNTWETVKSLSRVRLFVTPRTVAYHAPPSMGYSRQEYWSGLPFPSPGDLPDPGIEPRSPAFQADTLPSEPPQKPVHSMVLGNCIIKCIHHYSIIHSSFTVLKISCSAYSPPLPWTPGNHYLCFSVSLPFPGYYIVGIMQYIDLSDWLFHLVLHWRFLNVFSWLDSSFLFSTE